MAGQLAGANPYPLTHRLGFNIAEEAIVLELAPSGDPLSILTGDEVASGRQWSAKVMLMSGIAAEALHSKDSRQFQVGRQDMVICNLDVCKLVHSEITEIAFNT